MTDIQAWLDKGKTLADQATEGPWTVDGPANPGPDDALMVGPNNDGVIAYVQPSWADAEFITDSRTRLPQALTALQAVLEVHAPIDALNTQYTNGRMPRVCTGCGQDDGRWNYWPCPTVRAIQYAIKEQDA